MVELAVVRLMCDYNECEETWQSTVAIPLCDGMSSTVSSLWTAGRH